MSYLFLLVCFLIVLMPLILAWRLTFRILKESCENAIKYKKRLLLCIIANLLFLIISFGRIFFPFMIPDMFYISLHIFLSFYCLFLTPLVYALLFMVLFIKYFKAKRKEIKERYNIAVLVLFFINIGLNVFLFYYFVSNDMFIRV